MKRYISIIILVLILVGLILFSTVGYKYLSEQNSPQELNFNAIKNEVTNEISKLEPSKDFTVLNKVRRRSKTI